MVRKIPWLVGYFKCLPIICNTAHNDDRQGKLSYLLHYRGRSDLSVHLADHYGSAEIIFVRPLLLNGYSSDTKTLFLG